MSTTRRSRRREGVARSLLAGILLMAGTGCSLLSDDPPEAAGERVAPVIEEVRDLLRRRARAVRQGNLTAYRRGLTRPRSRFGRRQVRYFHNLQELPLAVFGYAVPEGAVVVGKGGVVRAMVRVRMQLDGYDVRTVVTPARYRFRRTRDGRLALAAVRDREFMREHDIELAPWEMTRIEVVEGDGVLGIFDAKSVDHAYQLVPAVEEGIDVVAAEVPLRWNEKVVVYALSDTRVLAELDNLPGGDPDMLDGVAFPVMAGRSGQRLASTRFMLHPRMLASPGESRARLIRHELVHVALGTRDDHVPTWLSEGLAEYISVRPIPTYERRIARAALTAARAGPDSMPVDSLFNSLRSGANYGLAWFGCEHIASAYGEDALWRLLDAMRADGGTAEADQDQVLREVLGITSRQLARAAGRRIVATFG